MQYLFKKKQILTIPNLLSLIRLALIPLIIWLYCVRGNYLMAIAVIALSGVTDIADGMIARKYHMVSDLGKILDPFADKMTQATLILCLTSRYSWMILLLIVFGIRELALVSFGYLSIKKKGKVNSAQWFGKLTTVVMQTVMISLILFPDIPLWFANLLIVLCSVVIVISLILYARFYKKILSE